MENNLTPDTARCNQLAAGRVFIYLTQRPRGVKLFASRELSPSGVSKRLLMRSDPGAVVADRMIAALLRAAKAAGLNDGKVPTPAAFAPFAATAAREAGAAEAAFLPRTPAYSARILVTL